MITLRTLGCIPLFLALGLAACADAECDSDANPDDDLNLTDQEPGRRCARR